VGDDGFIVNKQDLIRLIEEKGWKKIRQDSDYLGHRFHIIGERRFALTNWYIFFSFIDNLDVGNIEEFKKIIVDISKKSKSWFLGKWFLFCVIADRIDPQIPEEIRKKAFGPFQLPFEKRVRFTSIFSTMLVLIFTAIFVTFLVEKKIDWIMVFARGYFPLCGTIIFGLFSKGGGGNIFVLDLNEKKIYGEILTIPIPLKKYSKELNEILQKLT
jgi:hypothetical protein